MTPISCAILPYIKYDRKRYETIILIFLRKNLNVFYIR
jgi:hypothetical protein